MSRRLFDKLGKWLARFLESPSRDYEPFAVTDTATLARILQPGDVLLVEGNQRISVAIKYLTQSTWSHAAMFVGSANGEAETANQENVLIEADLSKGVIAVPLSDYANFNTRICRPYGLTDEDRLKVVNFMKERIGYQYDLKNVIDLMRYLVPTPPVPVRWRRRMLALGSGDPTRAICSTLIAQAFQTVKFPILPESSTRQILDATESRYTEKEIFHIRHYSLFTPRDFDISPYFQIVKSTLEKGFDYRSMEWEPDNYTE